ncbi:MAG: nucleotide-binding universal stress UspA family protein [Candidatus Azotimanducaceae bacterium]|jgi:nucleotide-binding universal stress UspA family protein
MQPGGGQIKEIDMSHDRPRPGKHKSAAVALDFIHSNSNKLVEHARRLVPNEQLHLIHVVSLNGCYSGTTFEPSCMEQEYWLCDAQLKEVGDELGIPLERQTLLVGSIHNLIAEYVEHCEIDLLVLGSASALRERGEKKREDYPIDAIARALYRTRCDLLQVCTEDN